MGFINYPVGDVGSTPALGGVGLGFIASQTFSAASTVSFNGCFTAAYENYRVVISADATVDMDVQIRLRLTGSDNSSAVYFYTCTTFGASSYIGTASGTLFTIAPIDTPGQDTFFASVDIYAPQLAKQTGVYGTAAGSKTAVTQGAPYSLGGFHDSTTQFDGFSVIASTSSLTGTVTVYGYQRA